MRNTLEVDERLVKLIGELHELAQFIRLHADFHHKGQKFRSKNLWSRFMAMLIGQLTGHKGKGISKDQQIRIKGIENPLRLVAYIDPETGKKYRYVTNAHHLQATEVAINIL